MSNRVKTLVSEWSWGQTAVVAALLFMVRGLLGPISETDLYWHLLMGADILHTGRLTGNPNLTFGPHQDWQTTQSVSEVLMYLWFQWTGWAGFVAARIVAGALLAGVTIWAVATLIPRTLTRFRLWVAVALAASCLSWVSVQERPQAISFILLPILGVALLRALHTGRFPNLLLVFAVTMVWGWFHGAALMVAPLFGFVWLVRMVLGRTRWAVPSVSSHGNWWGLLVAVSAFLGTLVNPIGWHIYQQASAISQSAGAIITEWERPFPNYPVTGIAPLLLLALWLLSAWALRHRNAVPVRALILDALFLLPLAVYAETANRAVPVVILLVIPLVGRRLCQTLSLYWKRPLPSVGRKFALPVAAVLAVIGIGLSVGAVANAEPLDETMPARILSGLADTTDKRYVIGDYNLTGRIQLLTQPKVRTALDGRADRYSVETLYNYYRLMRAYPTWRAILETDYAESTDFVGPADSLVVPKLQSLGWKTACVDGTTIWLIAPNITGTCPAVAGPLSAHFNRSEGLRKNQSMGVSPSP